MIGGGFVVGDNRFWVFPKFGKVPEQRFSLIFWIEVYRCFRRVGASLVIGELPEQDFALFRIERDLLLRSCFVALGD